ncbi:hypothetical protein [Phenylobacterium sp.]|uniref:terminase small subunit-like protein n=1 Tax=Phenylobacterium sp. TaxID=1871053 RepID=UPI00271D67E6|nr:hypothetical protein [Phenylobacterium sp.]MDO8378194.1 hypothetical protein [Phenylobacterium sp.]
MVPAYPRAEMMVRICEAVEKGWRLEQLEKRPGWPSRQTIYRWTLADPAFAQRMKYAREWRYGLKVSATAGPVYDPERAEAFLMEVRRGAAIREVLRRPEFPTRRRLKRWKSERPDFAAALEVASRVARKTRPRKWARYDEKVADEIIRRVAFGEFVADVEADPSLPSRPVLARWRRMRPDFDKALRVAKLSGRHHRRHNPRRLTAAVFDHVLTRMTAGACLRDVAREARMPGYTTLMNWQARNPDFAKMVAWARAEGAWARGLDEVARVDALAKDAALRSS